VLVYPALHKINAALAHLFIHLVPNDYSPKMTPEATIWAVSLVSFPRFTSVGFS
jgi:hypothetical protein